MGLFTSKEPTTRVRQTGSTIRATGGGLVGLFKSEEAATSSREGTKCRGFVGTLRYDVDLMCPIIEARLSTNL